MSETDHIPDIWPPCTSLLTHIAYDGGIGECPNATEDDMLQRCLASFGHSPSQYRKQKPDPLDRTRIPFVVVLYQSGMHGPQNGFRLILAESGIAPEPTAEALDAMGPIRQSTTEMIYLSADGSVEVVQDMRDGLEGAREVTGRVVQRLSGLAHGEWGLGVENVKVDGSEGSIARPIRASACYPLSSNKKGAAISDEPLTGRGFLLHTKSAGEGVVREGVVLVKQGVSPEYVEEVWMDTSHGLDSGDAPAVTVFEPDGRVLLYDGVGAQPVEIRPPRPITVPQT